MSRSFLPSSPAQDALARQAARDALAFSPSDMVHPRIRMEKAAEKLYWLQYRKRRRAGLTEPSENAEPEEPVEESGSKAEGKKPISESTSTTFTPLSELTESAVSSPLSSAPSSPSLKEHSPLPPPRFVVPTVEQVPQKQPKLIALHGPRQPGEPRRCPTIEEQRGAQEIRREQDRRRERSPTPQLPAMKCEDREAMSMGRLDRGSLSRREEDPEPSSPEPYIKQEPKSDGDF